MSKRIASKEFRVFDDEYQRVMALMYSTLCYFSDAHLTKLLPVGPSILAENTRSARQKMNLVFSQDEIEQFEVELTIVKVMAAFEWFLATTLEQYYLKHRDLLNDKSLVSVRIGDIRNAKNKEEIHRALIKNFVKHISFQGGSDSLLDYFGKIGKKKKSIKLNVDDITNFKKMKTIRNLYQHNGGIISEDFKKNFGKPKLRVGQKVTLSFDDFLTYVGSIRNIAFELDKASPSVVNEIVLDAMKRRQENASAELAELLS